MRLSQNTSPDRKADRLVEVVPPKALPAESELERMFCTFYERLFPRGMDHARRTLGHEEAKDAVQAAMAEMWYNWKRLLPEQRTAPYFFGALHHHVGRQRRAAAAWVSLEDAESELTRYAVDATEAPTRWTAVGDAIDLAVARMSRRQREVFLLHREQGFTYKEVATTLRVSEGTINTHMYKAMERVRTTLVSEGYRIKGTDRPRLPRETGDPTHE